MHHPSHAHAHTHHLSPPPGADMNIPGMPGGGGGGMGPGLEAGLNSGMNNGFHDLINDESATSDLATSYLACRSVITNTDNRK